MPIKQGLHKVLVVGSGPIVIGQAAEFDYAGTQACRSLREEGLQVVLINSNPATIMTDANMADRIYIEPITPEFVTRVIEQEKPDGFLPSLGGQVGLNMALELSDLRVLEQHGVQLLGTSLEAIKKAEDREMFKATMEQIGEPVPEGAIVSSVQEAEEFARCIGYPLVVRPAYTLGGTGGGMVYNQAELEATCTRGLKASIIHQVLIERSVEGWKEIEFEVMRDGTDHCITICSMENIDPVGIHTGDSIVVAPAQTLTQQEYQMLQEAAIKIIRALKVEGGCNVQFALHPHNSEYCVIEVNPRVSRSSALASKATGYPIAKVASKIAAGLSLAEIKNAVTDQSYAAQEPVMDYAVVKFPRWPFDKFALADRTLGTQMKSTGEVMAIDRTVEGALLKAIRSLEIGVPGLIYPGLAQLTDGEIEQRMSLATDERLFVLAEGLRRGWSRERIQALTKIDGFFIDKINRVVQLEVVLSREGAACLTPSLLLQAKQMGMADAYIAQAAGVETDLVEELRQTHGIWPVYKMVDIQAVEQDTQNTYFYSCYEDGDQLVPTSSHKVVVLGGGPIRIGQGIEFDYCSVHSVWALKELGVESIIINNNPETVSTDFDTADRLYFEPLLPEDVLNILAREKPAGVIVQFGGQTPINLALHLDRAGIKVLGTSMDDTDRAEDRERFDDLLNELDIPRPPGGLASSVAEAEEIAAQIGFPVLVRPSYVLGGRAMEIVYNVADLRNYMATAVKVTPEHPVLVDKYFLGEEIEVDAIADGETVLIPGIMRHVERAGVHSGDSIAVYPAAELDARAREQVVDYTTRLALALNVRGMINIQYVLYHGQIYVLEVNPRASRTVPYMSKITGIPMVGLATKAIIGHKLADMGYQGGLYPQTKLVGVKAPVFSFAKLLQVDISLGPEMKSTGEVLGVDASYPVALYKALLASGVVFPDRGNILLTVADKDKAEALPIARGFAGLGYQILATAGTARYLGDQGVPATPVNKVSAGSPHIDDLLRQGEIHLVINTLTKGKEPERDGFIIRRSTVELAVPCLTSLDTARAILEVLQDFQSGTPVNLIPLQEYLN